MLQKTENTSGALFESDDELKVYSAPCSEAWAVVDVSEGKPLGASETPKGQAMAVS